METSEPELPDLALSVRQPWAWAILHGGKVIENRSLGAIRAGNMRPGRICLHAARGMRRDEYAWGLWRLARHGVRAPRPEALVRGAIIGVIEVTGIITESSSEWFGGEAGLTLANPVPVDPIPAKGALGYFRWVPGGEIAPPAPWMPRFDLPGGDGDTAPLFPGLDPAFETPPPKPGRGRPR